MKKSDAVHAILGKRYGRKPMHTSASAYAPSNIALCKYWGKRDAMLNLPVTSSLSISLGNKGALTELTLSDEGADSVILNELPINWISPFGKRLLEYLNLFREGSDLHINIKIQTNIPIAAGLASSACGFASMIRALNQLFGWNLDERELSLLARLGSGSASRSIWQGFVEWHAGEREDGMDCYAEPLEEVWPELCVGLLVLTAGEKMIGSRDAMQRTVLTSPLYSAWPDKVKTDLPQLKEAIHSNDFELLGRTAESNALTMHATMMSSWPPICYFLPETIEAMQQIWQLRREGLPLYFTQDAGPNLKLLFLEKDKEIVQEYFPAVEVLQPFLSL